MTNTKWLSEDERDLQAGKLTISEYASRLAAERQRNAELVEALRLVHSCTMTGLCKHCRKTIDAALARNADQPHFRSVSPVNLSDKERTNHLRLHHEWITKNQFQKPYPPKKDD